MEPPARTLWPGTSRSCQLRSKPLSERRKLPARTKLTRMFFTDAEWVELGGGNGHQRGRGADDEGGDAGEPGGDGVGKGVAVERSDVGGTEVDEGEDDDRVLVDVGGGGGLAEALASMERMPVVRFSSSGGGRRRGGFVLGGGRCCRQEGGWSLAAWPS